MQNMGKIPMLFWIKQQHPQSTDMEDKANKNWKNWTKAEATTAIKKTKFPKMRQQQQQDMGFAFNMHIFSMPVLCVRAFSSNFYLYYLTKELTTIDWQKKDNITQGKHNLLQSFEAFVHKWTAFIFVQWFCFSTGRQAFERVFFPF